MAEVFIAMLVAVMILLAAVTTFMQSFMLFGTSKVISETNHGLQSAMSLMVQDFRQAGQGIPLGGVPIPSGAGSEPIVRPGPNPGMTFAASPTLPAVTPGSGVGPDVLGAPTDMVTVLYADRTLLIDQWPLTALALDGSSMTVDDRTPVTGVGGLAAGDIVLFSNANGSALQTVTATPNAQVVDFAAGDALKFNQTAAIQGTVRNLLNDDNTFPLTTVTRIVLVSYYIDVRTDATTPRLVRQLGSGPPLAIAMGIENLQFTYDLVDGVNNPSGVDQPPAGNSPNQVRQLNIFMSARSENRNPQTRQFFRNSMQTVVGLRSLSYVDRYR